MFLLVFSLVAFSKSVIIKGNWKDSSLKDEALVFFEKVEPSLLNKVKSSLENVDEDDQSEILNSLSKFVHQPLFGLLNLSLSLRFYQPIASIRSPKEGNPTLHGWYLLEKQNDPEIARGFKKVHFSLINSLSHFKSSIEKLNFLKKSSSSISSLTKQQDHLSASAKQLVNKYPQDYSYSGINGRIVKTHYFDILDGLIEEYRTSKLFSFSESLLHKNGYRQPHYYTRQSSNIQYLPPFNLEKVVGRWSDEPKLKSNDYMEVLRCKKPILYANIYFDLHSPESPALLNWAIEHVLKTDPIYFNFTLVFDMNNETEKHIGYAWHQAVDTLNIRNSVLFMIDGFKRNNFKRAYKATLPTVSWKKIKKNMVSGNKHTIRISDQLRYCKDNNITVGVAINGEFIQERPIFPIVEDKVFSYVTRIKKASESGVKIDFSRILDWTRDNSIQLKSSNLPIEITFNNYITINGFSNDVINNTANKIISLTEEKESPFKYPVIILNNKKNKQSKFDVDSSEFSEEELQLLKANKKDVFTIIGPLVFKGEVLNDKQLEFVQNYIDYVFITKNLESDLSTQNLLLALFFRSSNSLDGITRRPIKEDLPSTLRVDLITNSTLKWEIVEDPLKIRGPMILDMASRVFESGVASVIYHPNIKHDEYTTIPVHFNYKFSLSFDKDEIEVQNEPFFIRTTPYWSVRRERNNEYKVTSVITSNLLSPKGKRAKISDLLVTSTDDIGYFSPVLPIGKHKMIGIKSKSTTLNDDNNNDENYFIVDSFVPHSRFFYSTEEGTFKTSKASNNLNIVVKPIDDSYQSIVDIKVLLYSILNNSKKETNVKLFVSTDFPFEKIKDVDTKVVPCYLPHFYTMQQISNKQLADSWKYIMSDIYLPNEEKYLFLDQKILFIGDASRFTRLDMSDDAVIAAPVMTDKWFKKEKLPWNSRKFLMMRFKRPYHTSSLIWMDMERWSRLHMSDRFRMFLSVAVGGNNRNDQICEILFNSIQLYAQFITLPEEVAYNSNRSPPSLVKKALAIDLNAAEGIRLTKIKYEKVKQQALNKFD